MNNLLILGGIFLIMLISFLIGVFSNRKNNTVQKFIGSAKSFGPIVTGLSSMAAMVSGMLFVGGAGYIYIGGNFAALSAMLSCCFTLAYIMLGKKIRGMAEIRHVSTLGDIIDIRYNNNRLIKAFSSTVLFIGLFAYLITQVVAGATLFSYLFGWNPLLSACASFGVVMLYVIIGGESAGILSQAFQGLIVVIIGIIVLVIFFFQFGGYAGTMQAIAENPVVVGSNGIKALFTPQMLSAFGTDKIGASANTWIIFAFIGTACQPATLARMFALKNPHDMPKAGMISGITQGIACLTASAIGFSIIYLVAKGLIQPLPVADQAIWNFGAYLGPVMQVLICAIVVAAIISSSSMFLTLSAATLSKDLLSCLNIKLEGKKQVLLNRITIAVLGVAAILIAVGNQEMVVMIGFLGWGTLMSITLPVFVVGMVWKKASQKGMILASGTALVLNVSALIMTRLGFKWPAGLPWYMYVICCTVVISIVGSFFTYDAVKDRPGKKVEAAMNL